MTKTQSFWLAFGTGVTVASIWWIIRSDPWFSVDPVGRLQNDFGFAFDVFVFIVALLTVGLVFWFVTEGWRRALEVIQTGLRRGVHRDIAMGILLVVALLAVAAICIGFLVVVWRVGMLAIGWVLYEFFSLLLNIASHGGTTVALGFGAVVISVCALIWVRRSHILAAAQSAWKRMRH